MSENKLLAVLSTARDLIAKGYAQGARKDKTRTGYAYCALGAITQANNIHGVTNNRGSFHDEACDAANLALDAHIPQDVRQKMAQGRWEDKWNGRAGNGEDNTKLAYRDMIAARIAGYSNAAGQEKVVEWFDRAMATQREHPTEKVTF